MTQKPRKTKPIKPEYITRADLMAMGSAVDQAIVGLRSDIHKLARLIVNPPPDDCACTIVHAGPCPSEKTSV